MRLLLFMPDLAGGGAQRTLVNLANAFAARGHDVTLCIARGGGPARDWLAPAVRLVDLACGRTRNAVRPLARVIGQIQPDTILATIIDANDDARRAASGMGSVTSKSDLISGALIRVGVYSAVPTPQTLSWLPVEQAPETPALLNSP